MMRLKRFFASLFLLLALAGCTVATPAPPPAPVSVETASPKAELPATINPAEQTVVPTIEVTAPLPEAPPADATLEPALAAAPADSVPVPEPAAAQPVELALAQALPYSLQPNSPVFLPNFARSDLGCAWMGVAGQVFDTGGIPQKLVVVNVTGVLDGIPISNLGITGNALAYGPGGYEIDLSNQVRPSNGTLRIHLTDLQGNVISLPYTFNTYADCQRNLVLINFSGQSPYQRFIPLIIVNPES